MRHFGAYAYSVPFVPLYPCYGVRDREGEPSWNRQSQNCENGSDFLYTQNRTETATKIVVLSQKTILP